MEVNIFDFPSENKNFIEIGNIKSENANFYFQ